MGHSERKSKGSGKKIRKLYHLDNEDVQFVREYACQKGISESEVIRLSVRKFRKNNAVDPFLELIGSVNAGSNQASKHDEVIYE